MKQKQILASIITEKINKDIDLLTAFKRPQIDENIDTKVEAKFAGFWFSQLRLKSSVF